MALTAVTVTFDIADLAGVDFDARRTKVYATTNVPSGVVIDTVGNQIRLGSGNATIASDGTGSISVWAPGAGSNPDSWQTTIHVDYPDRNADRGRRVQSFGSFTITADANLADLVAEMPVQPEYASAILQEVSGYDDHGNVSGAVTFDAPTGTHVFDATAPTTITLDGYTNGQTVALVCFSGASDVTVNDAGDLELVDGLAVGMLRARDTWISGGGSGEPVTPDTTPPTAVTGLAATGGSQQITASWSPATDAESAVKYYWRVWLTSGGATGSYTMTTSTSLVKTGLDVAGNYTVQVYSASSGGTTTPVTATATVTAPPATLTETFTRADGTSMLGQATTTGGYTWGTDSGGLTLVGSSSNTGITTGNKYAGPTTQAISVNLGQSNAVLTMDYDISAGGSSTVSAAIAGTTGTNTITAIVDRGYNETRLFYDGTVAPEATTSSPPTTGTLELRYEGTTITVKINGATLITRTRTATGTKVALAAVSGGTIDNVTVTPL